MSRIRIRKYHLRWQHSSLRYLGALILGLKESRLSVRWKQWDVYEGMVWRVFSQIPLYVWIRHQERSDIVKIRVASLSRTFYLVRSK